MKRTTVVAALLLVAAAFGVGRLQPRLARTVHAIKERDDVYVLPPPAELHMATLGWDAAVVDLIWAKLLVEFGTHWSEHREFRDIPKYTDAILELEPTYAPIYNFIDTMLAYRPLQGTEDDVRMARAYLERGMRERPNDPSVFMKCGDFLSYIAPSFLHDEADRDAWRKAGAEAIERAVELGAQADRALSAATLLTRAGASEEAIRFLERAYAFTEHPSMNDVHEAIGRRLAALTTSARMAQADEAARTITERWERELRYVPRELYLVIGPKVDPARCSGLSAASDSACARDWVSALASPALSEDSP